MKIILTVRHEKGKTILSNGKGSEWCMKGVDDETAIASLVFYTLKSRFKQMTNLGLDFKLEVTLSEEFIEE